MRICLFLILLIPSLSWGNIVYLECVLKDVEKEHLVYKEDINSHFLNIIIDENELFIEKAWRVYFGEIDREELTSSKFIKESNTETINYYSQLEKPKDINKVYYKYQFSAEIHKYNLQLKLNSRVDLDYMREATIFDAETNSSRKLTEKELDELYNEFGYSTVEVYECNQKEALI